MEMIVCLLIVLLVASPFLKKAFDRAGLTLNEKEYEILKKVVQDAIAYIEQLATSQEMLSETKKQKAIEMAEKHAKLLQLKKTDMVGELIEASLWREDFDETEDEDESY